MTMRFDYREGRWFFTDEFGHVWRLTPTGDESMPLIIEIAAKAAALSSSAAPQEAAFSENETKDVLTALYQDGHVDLVLADRVAAVMASAPMTEREQALWDAARALMVAVVASPTSISADKPVAAAMDALIFTRARLRLEPLDGYTAEQTLERLIAFWTAQKAAL